MEEKQFLEILVKRYINNELDKNELEAFFHLLDQGKLDAVLDKHLDIEKNILSIKKIRHNGRVRFWTPTFVPFKIAASIVLFFTLGLTFYLNIQNVYAFLGKNYLITVETRKGEKKVINLPDGSVVWLNESSTLEYPSKFESAIRKISLLEGEAYFDVKRDERKPFHVEAAGTQTKVLGTAFNIRSYSYLQNVQVTVTRGKVAVEELESDGYDPAVKILLPNEQASVNLKTKEIKKVLVNSANAMAWREGKLLFDNERLADITTILENKFDVKISFKDNSIKNYHISAEFISTDSIDHVLELLSLANNLNYQINDNKITISKRKKIITNQMPM